MLLVYNWTGLGCSRSWVINRWFPLLGTLAISEDLEATKLRSQNYVRANKSFEPKVLDAILARGCPVRKPPNDLLYIIPVKAYRFHVVSVISLDLLLYPRCSVQVVNFSRPNAGPEIFYIFLLGCLDRLVCIATFIKISVETSLARHKLSVIRSSLVWF